MENETKGIQVVKPMLIEIGLRYCRFINILLKSSSTSLNFLSKCNFRDMKAQKTGTFSRFSTALQMRVIDTPGMEHQSIAN